MEELRKSLDRAYSILSTIPVAGDAVEKMAAARAELRKAYALTEAKKDPAVEVPHG